MTNDIIILGGGLVGLTAANLCAQQGFSVALIEQKEPDFSWDTAQYDIRCSTISRASQTIFQKLGVWKIMVEHRISPYQRMRVWDALGFGEISFDATEVAEPNLGHIIENRVMIQALWAAAEKDPNLTLFVPAKPAVLQIEPEHICLTLNDAPNEHKLRAKLIIGADGTQSWLRTTAGIQTTHKEYLQDALVATVQTELAHQETAYQGFLKEGPLAFLPLSDPQLSSIVWTATPETIKKMLALPDMEFRAELGHAFGYRLGDVLSVSERRSFSLNRLHAKPYIGERIALMGDAIHVIHPLAGQGLNLGLGDAQCLAEILSASQKKHQDIAHPVVLRKYERARKGQISSTLLAMEGFNRLFGDRNTLTIGLRSLGLNFVDKTSTLKKKIILTAMGL